MNLSPNWTNLGFVPAAVLVTLPKFAEPTLVLGGANCVRLKRLKNSVRNSSPNLLSGPNWVRLNNAKSKLFTPEPRRLESVRDSLPKVKSAGEVKQEVLNHSLSFEVPVGRAPLLQPATKLGREPPPNDVV